MTAFARSDTSLLGQWWWTIDRWTLAAICALAGTGIVMALAASPSVAVTHGYDFFYLARRQLLYVPLAAAALLGVSLLSPKGVVRASAALLALSALLVAATFFAGVESRGARRWLDFGPLTIQPSEFVKPAFAVVAAWLFAAARSGEMARGNLLSIGLFGLLAGLFLLQPDVGMTVVVSAVWAAQFFLAGLPFHWVALLGAAGAAAMTAGYFALPHVARRIDTFLDPGKGDTYQVDKSLDAFANGGLFGLGPGEGTVKSSLPDAHSDFVFAVAGEEFGLFACLMIVFLFAFVVLRGFARVLQGNDLFVLIAASGLLVQFGLQAAINMGSTLRIMPTKGMTLPFVSYGGSSLIATALGMGLLLALTRRRAGSEPPP